MARTLLRGHQVFLAVVGFAFAAALLPASVASASPASWNTELVSAPTGRDAALPDGAPSYLNGEQISSDGERVVFATREQLVPADSNAAVDVYERANGVTRLVSAPGPGEPAAGGMNAMVVGDSIYFESRASLVPEDADGGLTDVYEDTNGAIHLISAPEADANGPDQDAILRGVSADRNAVFFTSAAHLTADDDDGCLCSDIFVRTGGETQLISAPGAGATGGSGAPAFDAASSDGSRVFFLAPDSLTSEDTDEPCKPMYYDCWDVYERHDGKTQLVSAPAPSIPESNGAGFDAISEDGSHVFFTSPYADNIYERFEGQTQLVSAPAPGGNADGGLNTTDFGAASADGTKVFFSTAASLVPEDTDGGYDDVYERSGGVTTLVSTPGPGADPVPTYAWFDGASRDGSHAFFESQAQYTANDSNDVSDIYDRAAGSTELVSGASDNTFGVQFAAAAADGSRVFFSSSDGIYQHSDGRTTLVSSPGPGGVPDPVPQPLYKQVSDDGTRIIWQSNQRMSAADTDDRPDIYEGILGESGADDPPPGGSGDVAGEVSPSPRVDVHRVISVKRWRKLIDPGVRVLASCDSDCRINVVVRSSRAAARAMGLTSDVMARGSACARAGEARWVRARALGAVRRALSSYAGKGRLHITVIAT